VLLIPLALGILTWMNATKVVRSGANSQDGVPVEMIFFMGSVMLLGAAGDVRMLVRGGVVGAKRIARHLWRMCFGLFIAAGSFFLGPSNRPLRLLSSVGLGQHLSPALFSTTLYLILTLLPLILLMFWLVPVRFTNASKRYSLPGGDISDLYGPSFRPLLPARLETECGQHTRDGSCAEQKQLSAPATAR
jgi:hypothetical protein